MEANNIAAMREALLKVSSSLCSYCRRRNCEGCIRAASEFMSAVRKALTLPPRNCDRFGGDFKMLHTAWFDWTGSPSGQNEDGTVKMDFSEWLLAPAKESEVK